MILALSLLANYLREAQLSELIQVQQRLIGTLAAASSKQPRSSTQSGRSIDVFSSARLLPVYESGALVGLRVSHIVPDRLFAKLGARDGDVIETINGRRIDTPEAVARGIAEMISGEGFVLKVAAPDSTSRILEFAPDG